MDSYNINCKLIASAITENIKTKVEKLKSRGIVPCLASISVCENGGCKSYSTSKIKACKEVGIEYRDIQFGEHSTNDEISKCILDLNSDPSVNGIMIQNPMPSGIDSKHLISLISPIKDIDCMTPYSIGMMTIGNDSFIPCTPKAVVKILNYVNSTRLIKKDIKNVVVIGRSNVVGRPVATLLSRKDFNATVTICHTGTPTDLLNYLVSRADSVVVATGKPNTFDYHDLPIDCVLVDVGINSVRDCTKDRGYRLIGDVYDYEDNEMIQYFESHRILYTSVPGGVGPVTTACLMENVLETIGV